MSIHDVQRVKLRITEWSQSEGTGVVVDKEGMRYKIRLADMGPEFQRADLPIRVGEAISGVVTDFDSVRDIMSDHRVEFEIAGGAV